LRLQKSRWARTVNRVSKRHQPTGAEPRSTGSDVPSGRSRSHFWLRFRPVSSPKRNATLPCGPPPCTTEIDPGALPGATATAGRLFSTPASSRAKDEANVATRRTAWYAGVAAPASLIAEPPSADVVRNPSPSAPSTVRPALKPKYVPPQNGITLNC